MVELGGKDRNGDFNLVRESWVCWFECRNMSWRSEFSSRCKNLKSRLVVWWQFGLKG